MVPLFPIGLDFSFFSLRFPKRLHLRDSTLLQPGLTLGRRDNAVLCSLLLLGEQGFPVGRPQIKIVTGSDFQSEVSAAEGVVWGPIAKYGKEGPEPCDSLSFRYFGLTWLNKDE